MSNKTVAYTNSGVLFYLVKNMAAWMMTESELATLGLDSSCYTGDSVVGYTSTGMCTMTAPYTGKDCHGFPLDNTLDIFEALRVLYINMGGYTLTLSTTPSSETCVTDSCN